MKERWLRVRPRKEVHMGPCTVELTAMLACWASNADVHNSGPCKDLGVGLSECMRKAGGPQRAKASTINYHLGKWSKKI
ncbi:unnamed protein product [Sympodiomycopsis kandeliae]